MNAFKSAALVQEVYLSPFGLGVMMMVTVIGISLET